MHPILAFGIGPVEIAVFAIIVLLLFGKRIPEVARSLGLGLSEFKKGIREGEEAEPPRREAPRSEPRDRDDRRIEPIAPKFDPPTAPPTDAGGTS